MQVGLQHGVSFLTSEWMHQPARRPGNRVHDRLLVYAQEEAEAGFGSQDQHTTTACFERHYHGLPELA
jgi:hypothetical protein